MSAIDRHVDVQIDKATATVSRVGFGTPCILTYHTVFPEVYRTFANLTEMADAGFTTGQAAYKMASAIFAQSPRPAQVVVGRRSNPVIRDVKLTPRPVLANTAYTVEINGTAFTYTTDATPTDAEITAGLVALIDAGSENVDATDNTTDFDIEKAAAPGGAATAGEAFYVDFDRNLFLFKDNTVALASPNDMASEITDLRNKVDDWYGLVTDCWGADEIGDVAAAIESAGPKIYAAESQDSDIGRTSTTDLASTLQTAAYDRTFVFYSPSVNPGPATGLLGKQLPTDPGSTTWKFKTLNGVAAADLLSGGITNAEGKNANTYTTVGGINITAEGVMASGEFIDVTRFVDWLEARIKENVFRALAINPKIPYTDSGIQAIVAEVEGVLRQGVFNGGINGDEDLTVTAPLASEVDANDKASRLLPDIEFSATLAGAIHKTVIRGTVVA